VSGWLPTAATERGALGLCAEAALEEHSEDAGNRHGGSSFRNCRVAWLKLWFPLVTIN